MAKKSFFLWMMTPLSWIIILLCLGPVSIAQAHSLGQETLNKHSLFRISGDVLELEYTLDMAEKPTFEELRRMDSDNDEYTTQAEADQYVLDTAERLVSNFDLSVNGRPVTLEMTSHEFDVSMSGHELPVLYLQYRFEAELAPADAWSFEFDDANFPRSIGWHEVVVQPASGLAVLESTVATKDLSRQLSRLPRDLTLNPVQSDGTWTIAADQSEPQQARSLLLMLLVFGSAIGVGGLYISHRK